VKITTGNLSGIFATAHLNEGTAVLGGSGKSIAQSRCFGKRIGWHGLTETMREQRANGLVAGLTIDGRVGHQGAIGTGRYTGRQGIRF
jgi:hypothetical protein